MRRTLQSLAVLLVLMGMGAPLAAQTTTGVTYTGNYGWVYDGYYVGPYKGTVSYLGSEVTDIYCVDSANMIDNYSWSAYATSLGSGSLENTYLGGGALNQYWQAAYLTQKYWQPGIDRYEVAAIHAAIWQVTTGSMPSGFALGTTALVDRRNALIGEAQANYQTINPNEWVVLSDVAATSPSQEFLVRDPNVVPEPETWLMLITGLGGILGMGLLRGRLI